MPRNPMRKRPFVKADKGMLLGYARVSKGDEQSNKAQATALRAAGCRRLCRGAGSFLTRVTLFHRVRSPFRTAV
jgi:hypothetical protein